MVTGIFSLASTTNKPAQPIKQVPFTQVHFTDNFWAPHIEINRTVSIPSAFKDCYNTLYFTPVKTTGLKIVAKLQKNVSGGVLEWKVN